MNTKTINIQVLALLGDAVYSLYIREKLIKEGINDSNKLQKLIIEYVSAKGEVKALNYLIENNYLTEEEQEIIKRGIIIRKKSKKLKKTLHFPTLFGKKGGVF